MWRWTIKSVWREPAALLSSVLAVGAALSLVMFFEAVFAGEAEQIVAYVKRAPADVWVMQKGVANMHMSTSYLADWKVAQIRKVPGVESAEPILYLSTVVRAGDKQWYSYVVGLDVPSTVAGPWAMAAGSAEPGAGQVVVPEVLASLSAVGLGDEVRIADRQFTIVGLSQGTFSIANPVLFVTKVDLEDVMESFDIVSFILVESEPGVDAALLAERIESEVDNVHAMPAEQFATNDRSMALKMGVETIALMTVIGGVLAVLLVAFTVYSQVARQRRELAVVKALGVGNAALYVSVAIQAALVASAGSLVAVGVVLAATPLTRVFLPQVTLLLTAESVGRIAAIGIGVAIAASWFPARQIARVDPLSAFKS